MIYDTSTGIPRIGKDINYSTEGQDGRVTINAEEPKSFSGQEIVIGFAHTHYIRGGQTIREEISPSVGDVVKGARGLEREFRKHEYKIRNRYKVHHPHLKMWIALVYEDSENNQHLVVKGYDTRMSTFQAQNNKLLDRKHKTTVFFLDRVQDDIFFSIFLNSDGTLTDRCSH